MNTKHDHPHLVLNPFVLLTCGLVALGLLRWLLPLWILPVLPARILGAVILVAGLLFGLPAMRAMVQVRTSPNPNHPSTALALSGTYRLSRNPMYLGMFGRFRGYFSPSPNLVGLHLVAGVGLADDPVGDRP